MALVIGSESLSRANTRTRTTERLRYFAKETFGVDEKILPRDVTHHKREEDKEHSVHRIGDGGVHVHRFSNAVLLRGK